MSVKPMSHASVMLWEAFRRGDEYTVLQMLRDDPALRHSDADMPMRAACWLGMERVARIAVESWAVELTGEHVDIARRRGHEALAVWLDARMFIKAGREMDTRQLSFIA